jgi:hypothetical protein
MKSILSISCLFLLLVAITTTGCEQDECTRAERFVQYEPVYKRIDEMRIPMAVEAPRVLTAPGKIFYYNGYLLINELNQGIHVIDNREPANPQKIAFLNIPGNIDMAINNKTLYVDSYLDLVAIDLTNITAPAEVSRITDVFQSFYSFSDELGYLVEYKATPIEQTIDCSNNNWGRGWWVTDDLVLLSSDASFGGAVSENASSVNTSVVVGGSMARFTVAKNHLYTIDGGEVKVFNVSQVEPSLRNEVQMQWGIETLFPLAGTLFVGSNSGLLIYDITNPESPEYRSTFSHATSCDPVFVTETTAYVTLRSGTPCEGFTNQLDVIDVGDITAPKLLASYPMDNPHGLSLMGDILYLCEGEFGFKTFDVTDVNNIDQHMLDHYTTFDAYDVIVLPPGDLAIVIGKEGLVQLDATNKQNLSAISYIEIGK